VRLCAVGVFIVHQSMQTTKRVLHRANVFPGAPKNTRRLSRRRIDRDA
jgi:hypothetical protein